VGITYLCLGHIIIATFIPPSIVWKLCKSWHVTSVHRCGVLLPSILLYTSILHRWRPRLTGWTFRSSFPIRNHSHLSVQSTHPHVASFGTWRPSHRNLGALRWLVLQCTAACRGAPGWRPCGVAEGVPMLGMTWMWDSLSSKNYSRHAMQILKWPSIAMEIGPSSPSKIGSKVPHGDVLRDSHLTLVCYKKRCPKWIKIYQNGKGRVSYYLWCPLMLLIVTLW